MKEYETKMKQYYKIYYVEFNDNIDSVIKNMTDIYTFFQPNKLSTFGEIIPSPNFLCRHLFEKYRNRTDKFVFNNFYMWMKKKLNIYPALKSLDKYNRGTIPKKDYVNIPADPVYDKKMLKNAIDYVNKHFIKNLGPDLTKDFKWFLPINHKQSQKALKQFCSARFNKFATYQDFMYFSEFEKYEKHEKHEKKREKKQRENKNK
jgi:deoxyribodipyrimidine photolyase-like uncharacterized protein